MLLEQKFDKIMNKICKGMVKKIIFNRKYHKLARN